MLARYYCAPERLFNFAKSFLLALTWRLSNPLRTPDRFRISLGVSVIYATSCVDCSQLFAILGFNDSHRVRGVARTLGFGAVTKHAHRPFVNPYARAFLPIDFHYFARLALSRDTIFSIRKTVTIRNLNCISREGMRMRTHAITSA